MLIRRRWKEEYAHGLNRRLPSPSNSVLVLQRVAGKDASKQFWKYHNEGILKKYKGTLQVGSLDSKKPASPPTPPATPPAPEKVVPSAESHPVAPSPGPAAHEQESEALPEFGSLIPFADPNWYQSVGDGRVLIRSDADVRHSTTLHTTTRRTRL